jgi:tRNA-dihydrouridine synthase
VEPSQLVDRLRAGSVAGVLVGRGALRNPWIFQQARELAEGRQPREVTAGDRARFLLDYIDLLVAERVDEAQGFRHVAPGQPTDPSAESLPARGRERWVINKLRALNSWYTKGLDNGSHLRVSINAAENIRELREIIEDFFSESEVGSRG